MLNVGNKRKSGDNPMQSRVKRIGTGYVSMYNDPPTHEVSLDEFEEYSIDRLRVLKTIETLRAKGFHQHEFQSRLESTVNEYLPLRRPTSDDPTRLSRDTAKDSISHFILRMAFCQNEDLRRWFLSLESQLFRYRMDKLSTDETLYFMRQNGLDYEQATREEVEQKASKLRAVRNAWTIDMQEKTSDLKSFFKVPFYEALELVGSRRVYLEGGIAYVPFDHLISILFARFRANLSRQLTLAFKSFARSTVGRDERLLPVLKNLSQQHINSQDYTSTRTGTGHGNGESITPSQLNDLAKTSMPLCMSTLHNTIVTVHHLKHSGRMQYGLFLKGVGLDMEDALAFWKQHFCKKMSVDDFNKKYAYNIRHNYGKEGKRKDYTPYPCAKIINGEGPKAGEVHGCPFRHFDTGLLRSRLRGINEKDREEILTLTKGKHYQVACKKYFEATHIGADSDEVGTHPNGYFVASRKYYEKKQEPKEAAHP